MTGNRYVQLFEGDSEDGSDLGGGAGSDDGADLQLGNVESDAEEPTAAEQDQCNGQRRPPHATNRQQRQQARSRHQPAAGAAVNLAAAAAAGGGPGPAGGPCPRPGGHSAKRQRTGPVPARATPAPAPAPASSSGGARASSGNAAPGAAAPDSTLLDVFVDAPHCQEQPLFGVPVDMPDRCEQLQLDACVDEPNRHEQPLLDVFIDVPGRQERVQLSPAAATSMAAPPAAAPAAEPAASGPSSGTPEVRSSSRAQRRQQRAQSKLNDALARRPATPAPAAAQSKGAAAGAGAGPPLPAVLPGLSRLHEEVVQFAAASLPTRQEVAGVAAAVGRVERAATTLFSQARVLLFGSQASGLALPGSDLDIVVLGAGCEMQRAARGYSRHERGMVREVLEDLLDALIQGNCVQGRAQIIDAKVPIIKCQLVNSEFGGPLEADISLGVANGAEAVHFVARQIKAMPPLRPLVLVIKAFLKEAGMNEVFTGGLSSYSLCNMVIAHLQAEGFQADKEAAQLPLGPHNLSFVEQLLQDAERRADQGTAAATAATPAPNHSSATQRSNGHAGPSGADAAGQLVTIARQLHCALQCDLGVLLWGFFDRFGRRFKAEKEAVAVQRGGICKKDKRWRQKLRLWLLAVEDPQELGRDICSGTFNIRNIQQAFAAAADMLWEAAQQPPCAQPASAEGAEAAAWAAIQADGQSRSSTVRSRAAQQAACASSGGQGGMAALSSIIDVRMAVGRCKDGLSARAALGARAETDRKHAKYTRAQHQSGRGAKGARGGLGVKTPPMKRKGGKHAQDAFRRKQIAAGIPPPSAFLPPGAGKKKKKSKKRKLPAEEHVGKAEGERRARARKAAQGQAQAGGSPASKKGQKGKKKQKQKKATM